MTTDRCAEARFLLQADFDGELDVAGTAMVAAHVADCPDCAAEQTAMATLSARLRTEIPYHAAPARLREAIEAAIVTSAASPIPAPAPVPRLRTAARRNWLQLAESWIQRTLPVGGAVALAAALALVFVLPNTGGLQDAVVSDHIRALQPGHLMDVVSTDQHTVKPWFDGRIDFAPPVKDLKAEGFPLAGGRLDYLAGKPVAALIYQRRQHVIDLYVWPDGSHLDHGLTAGNRSGYNFLRWSQNGMAFWAVSDLAANELADFVRLLRTE
jgi:anti-sigma factor RsiW